MTTTVSLDDDVVTAVEALRRERGIGPSGALNELARAGAAVVSSPGTGVEHRPRVAPLGAGVDLDDVGGVLALLDEQPSP